jgi:hypothetical protein
MIIVVANNLQHTSSFVLLVHFVLISRKNRLIFAKEKKLRKQEVRKDAHTCRKSLSA